MNADLSQITQAQADDDRSAEELIEAYRAGSMAIRMALVAMSPDQLRARPIPGKWSSLEVLCHVADCDQFLADRMKRTIGTDLPLLVGIDATPYLERLHYHDRDPLLQANLIDATRQQMAADLELLDADAWQRQGVHTETGLVTLRQQLLHAIRHVEWHVAAIQAKRAALGA